MTQGQNLDIILELYYSYIPNFRRAFSKFWHYAKACYNIFEYHEA